MKSDLRWPGMILVSFLLHAFSLSFAILLPSMPAKKWTFGPVYTVDLVSVPADFQERKSTSRLSRDIAAVTPRDRQVVLKKEADRLPDTAVRHSPLPREESRKIERAIEDVRKKLAAQPGPVMPSASAGKQPAATPELNRYYAVIWARIKGQWALPRGVVPAQNLETVITVRILRDGSISSLQYEKSSGNRYFDQSAWRAVRKAGPFPHFPESLRESNIEVGIRFHSAEMR
ncbi:MAG TPA: energy transducer TonB [Syntrophales bacterium]|nr:energy transducer TonB [Syntrophales bacterium]